VIALAGSGVTGGTTGDPSTLPTTGGSWYEVLLTNIVAFLGF